MPKTNTCVERDFGMFARFQTEKPKASVYALEAIIMCRKNHWNEWRDEMMTSDSAHFKELSEWAKE